MSGSKIIINGHFRRQQVTGVQRYALEIIKEFDQMNREYDFVSPPAFLASDKLRQIWMQSVMPLKVPDDHVLWSPTNIGPVFCNNQVLTLHDISDQLHPEWFDGMYAKWRSFILPRLLKRVKGIITVSEYSRQTILEQFPFTENKIKVIPNGVRTSHFYPREQQEITAVREKLQLNKPFIVTVGSLDPRKNINGLIKGWNCLPDNIKQEMELLIVGATAEKFNFTLNEKMEDSVRFLGYLDYERLPAVYSGAVGFVFPSLFEGFGLPVLEAMACRAPVITSNTTSLREIADNRALTVNPEVPIEIGNAIQQLIESEELQFTLGQKGFDYVQKFTWNNAAEQTFDYLKRLM